MYLFLLQPFTSSSCCGICQPDVDLWCRVKIGFQLWHSNVDLMKKYNSHFRNRERSLYIWKELGVELLLLCVESHKLMWFRHLVGWFLGASLWRFSSHAQDTLERLYTYHLALEGPFRSNCRFLVPCNYSHFSKMNFSSKVLCRGTPAMLSPVRDLKIPAVLEVVQQYTRR